ncbi:HAD family phosphatase [Clostridium sp. JN-9]|uniref:HAD family hydrolase n=1 Tax=Clostridium sp. JN-9 TaxID=2507159 RepID=UPI000FFE0E75|nr:HAD family phosphatase [Clostridium sp. JN-9]QAT39238.1 HAD family phosphatase [Clostridium sp. JN-9]
MLKAVIFDMDGVMIDSEPVAFRSFDILLKDRGLKYTMDFHKSIQGCVEIEVAKRLKEFYKLSESAEEILKLKNQIYFTLMEDELEPIEGLFPLLDYVKSKNLKCALVTGTLRNTTEKILSRLNIKDYFHLIVCGDEVEKGKPDPWVYKYAVEKLKADSSECVILEDSDNGITAAINAHCNVIAVNSNWKDKSQKNIIAYKDNLNGVDKILDELL